MNRDPDDLRDGDGFDTFESTDQIRSSVYRLPDRHDEMSSALPAALALACSLPDWSFGRARVLSDSPAADDWTWHRRDGRPVAATPDGGDPWDGPARAIDADRPAEGAEADDRPVLSLRALDRNGGAVQRDAFDRGLRTWAVLTVRAEARPVAELELFGEYGADGRDLRLLLSRLELVATRERSRSAVKKAVALVRKRSGAGVSTPDEARDGAGSQDSAGSGSLRHDVTGLPRGPLLEDRLGMAMRRRRREGGGLLAVLHVDPGLTDPADDVGFAAVARRLAAGVRDVDTVSHAPTRATGAGFVVVVEDTRLEEARELAARLLAAVRRPVRERETNRSPVRIGIVIAGVGYEGPREILRDAELAARGGSAEGGIRVLDEAVRQEEEDRALLESELRRALAAGELLVEYQPSISLESGRIMGLEALVRWEHPKVGRIPPGEFVHAASVSPLIHEFGDWVVDRVCRQIVDWQAIRGPGRVPPVDVNFLQVQLLDSGFAERLVDILDRHGLPGECLRLDVAEGDIMDAPAALHETLVRLRRQGLHAVIDDFGTAFSSVSRLESLPVAGLKIDGTFIPETTEGIDGWTTARAIAQLGRAFGLEVTAEAVERVEQIGTLRQIGCHRALGNAIGEPAGAEDTLSLLQDGVSIGVDFPSD